MYLADASCICLYIFGFQVKIFSDSKYFFLFLFLLIRVVEKEIKIVLLIVPSNDTGSLKVIKQRPKEPVSFGLFAAEHKLTEAKRT